MEPDVLFRWMSENGSGSLRYLRDRICWFYGVTDQADPRRLAGLWIRDAVARGMLSVDWSTDKWRVPTAVLTTIPGRFNLALMTGGRPTELSNRLTVAIDQDDLCVCVHDEPSDAFSLRGPTAVFIEFRSINDLTQASQYLGIALRIDAYKTLAERLERVEIGKLTSSPMRKGTSVERWDIGRKDFDEFSPAVTWPAGLYRETVHGQKRHLLNHHGEWYETDRSSGVYLAANPDDQLIRWRPDYVDSFVGAVLVDKGVSLPDAHRRVLGMCTGLRPIVQRHSRSTQYDNVPMDIALKVSASLKQKLEILEPSIPSRSSNA